MFFVLLAMVFGLLLYHYMLENWRMVHVLKLHIEQRAAAQKNCAVVLDHIIQLHPINTPCKQCQMELAGSSNKLDYELIKLPNNTCPYLWQVTMQCSANQHVYSVNQIVLNSDPEKSIAEVLSWQMK